MGKKEHEAKKAALAGLGKDLSRRARSKCELCTSKDDLRPVLTMAKEEPDLDNVLLLCGSCAEAFTKGRIDRTDDFRFLEEVVWSEVPLVQAVAVRLLEQVDAPWARSALENLYLPDEARERVDGLEP